MTLFINTTQTGKAAVGLKKGGLVLKEVKISSKFGSQALLPAIVKVLEQNKIGFYDLDSIEVNTGPGSFTGIRVGVSVANALGFALNIPINGKKIETELQYG